MKVRRVPIHTFEYIYTHKYTHTLLLFSITRTKPQKMSDGTDFNMLKSSARQDKQTPHSASATIKSLSLNGQEVPSTAGEPPQNPLEPCPSHSLITWNSETADGRIVNLFKLPHKQLTRKFEKLWMGFRISPYPDGDLLLQLAKITDIPQQEIKLWCLAKRILLNISWTDKQIESNRHRPSTCDCTACNILYNDDNSWREGCYAMDLQMMEEFL